MAENPTLAFLRNALGTASYEETALVNLFMQRLILGNFTIDASGNITAPFITTSVNLATATGTLAVGNGGTGQITAGAAFDALAPTTTRGDIIARGASGNVRVALATGVVRSNGTDAVFGPAVLTSDVTGILPTANGGTGIAFFTAAGPTAARVYTFPDAACSVLTTNAAVTVPQGGTGDTTLTAHGVLIGEGTSAIAATSAGTAGQVLVSGGASADPTWATRVQLLDKSTTEQDVVNTAVETSVYSFSVPGGTLGTANTLRLTVTGYMNEAGSSHNLNIRVKWGGTVIASGSFTFTATTTGAILLQSLISAQGATNSQRAVTAYTMPPSGQNVTDGNFNTGTAVTVVTAAHSSLAIDSTANQTLQVTFQWDTGDANNHAKRWLAATELLS